MAVTYRARDTVLNSVVALKVIDCTIAANPAARTRFLREARAAAQLHHPNVARVTHYGEQEGECFYVMELVEGETLEARVRREGPMPLALALEVMEQAARALAAAEAHGIVHRDIKPSNLMIESEASGSILVKVIDYGIAKMTSLQAGLGIDQTQARICWHAGLCQPGAVCRLRSDGNRHALRHLLVRRDPLVSAHRPHTVCWPHAGRSPGAANERPACGTTP